MKIIHKDKLKPILKTIIREIYRRKLHESTSGVYKNYEVELDSVVVPGLTTEDDWIVVLLNIECEAQAGVEAKGLFGPPERSSPAENSEFHILDWDIKKITILDERAKPTRVITNIAELTPEQLAALKQHISAYIEQNKKEIESKIVSSIDTEPDYSGHGEDYFDEK